MTRSDATDFSGETDFTPGCDGVGIAAADEGEGAGLRGVAFQRLGVQRMAQIARQRWALANRVDAGFRARVLRLARAIAGGEYVGVGERLQG